MRKKILKVKCPRHILFGDPSYFEEFSGKRLKSLVVDCRPPEFFEARVELREKPMEGYPDIMLRSMVIYLAPKQTIGVYMDGKMFESQEVVQKDIGVDTAEYVINVDGRYENIHTGGDGYWGGCDEFYHKKGKQKICDAVMIAIAIPDSETFEGMEQLANYFFEDVHEVGRKEKAHRKEETAR